MSSGARTMTMLLGLLAVIVITGALQVLLPTVPLASGIAAGVGITYIGFILYYFLFPRPGAKKLSFFHGYIPGVIIRYSVMIGVFCAVIFWLDTRRMFQIGVLLGAFIGMMISTFVSLNLMRRTQCKPPEV
ncbi:MAG: hypothetical protein JW768_07775 [Chitinispirillaceae bacterium]|nr:hypothetical protein [Chitinispirillaceae bacterium]